MKRVDCKFDARDMLTHSPSVEELRKFFPMVGCHTMTVKKEYFMQSRDAEGLAAKNHSFMRAWRKR